MLSLKTTQGKIALVLVSFAMLWTYNSFNRPTHSIRQQAYERWLLEIEQDLKVQARADKPLPELQILVRRKAEAELEQRLVLKEPKNLPKILRVLELIREANLFSFRRGLDFSDPAEQGIEVEVRAPGQVFLGAMSSDEIEQSVQAKTFLTLYNVFYLEQQSGSLNDEAEPGTSARAIK